MLQAVADWIVPEGNPSATVYGIIVIGALLAAESDRHETYLDALASAALAAVLYWFAHSYASVLGRRLATGERLELRALARALRREWPLLHGAIVPLGALAIAWTAGASQADAVTTALWSAVGSIVAFELIAGLRSRATSGELALETAVGACIGLGILGLKVILH